MHQIDRAGNVMINCEGSKWRAKEKKPSAMKKSSVETIVESLNAAGVEYLIAGGLAVVTYGYMRLTADMDLIVALEPDNAKRAMNTLTALGYRPRVPVKAKDFADPVIREKWIKEKGMMVFSMTSNEHPETPVDIFVTVPFAFADEYRKANWFDLSPGLKAPFVSLDQLIRMKKKAGREQDKLDVAHLEQIRKTLSDEKNGS